MNAESTTPHPESQDGRQRPTIPAGTMRRYWCITKAQAPSKEHARQLCYGNAYVMPLSDEGDAPDNAIPVGDDGDYAWTGWWEESCDLCDTYWAFHGEVLAWLELPQTVEALNAASLAHWGAVTDIAREIDKAHDQLNAKCVDLESRLDRLLKADAEHTYAAQLWGNAQEDLRPGSEGYAAARDQYDSSFTSKLAAVTSARAAMSSINPKAKP